MFMLHNYATVGSDVASAVIDNTVVVVVAVASLDENGCQYKPYLCL